jgi:hypothetical protein
MSPRLTKCSYSFLCALYAATNTALSGGRVHLSVSLSVVDYDQESNHLSDFDGIGRGVLYETLSNKHEFHETLVKEVTVFIPVISIFLD